MTEYNLYEINSGYIFSEVCQNWKKYDRDFLATTFRNAIETILCNKKKFTVIYTDDQEDYFKNYTEVRYARDLNEAKDANHFPFPDYLLVYKEPNDKYPSIISCEESVIIPKESIFFDLFFALKLSVTDIMQTDCFLEYHLENSFTNNFSECKYFLENLLIKYSEFLKTKYEPVIVRFINNKTMVMENNSKSDIMKNSEHTLARQVLAIHYMLNELGINQVGTDKTEIARFIQFLIGKELNAQNIRNTNIYKRVKNVLSISEKFAEADLQYVRSYFEKLGLTNIAKKISKEIASKE